MGKKYTMKPKLLIYIIALLCILPLSFSAIPSDFVAHYAFENNLSDYNNTNNLLSTQTYVSAKFGQGLNNTRTTSSIAYLYNASNIINKNQVCVGWSFSVWVNFTNVQNISGDYYSPIWLFSNDNMSAATGYRQIGVNRLNSGAYDLSCFMSSTGTSTQQIESGVNPTQNTAYNVICSYNGTHAKIYVDNVLKGSEAVTCSGSTSQNVSDLGIGGYYNNGGANRGGNYSGYTDSIYFYRRALTDGGCTVGNSCSGEVSDLYTATGEYAPPSEPNPIYYANLSLYDFMGNLVTTPYTAIVNGTNYTNGTNIQMYNGTAYNITVVSFVYHNKTQEFTVTLNNTVINMTNLSHKFPTQFKNAYLMNKDANYFYDVNNTLNLRIQGQIGTNNLTSYINASNASYQSLAAPTSILWNTTPVLSREDITNATRGWTISMRISFDQINQTMQSWIFDSTVGGSNGTEIFFAKDDDSSSNYSLIAGIWGSGADEIELSESETTSFAPQANTTYHLILRYNGTKLTYYINGKKVDENTTTNLPFGNKGSMAGTNLFALGNPAPSSLVANTGMRGNISSLYIYNYALSDENCAVDSGLQCGGEIGTLYYTPYEYNTFATPIINFTITSYDIYTNSTLNTFNVTLDSVTYNTTTGTIEINLSTLQKYNFTVLAPNYFNKTYTNYNISSNLNTSMAQSVTVFSAYEKVSGSQITTANFTTTKLTNVTHYMDAQAYNVTATASGYNSRTIEYTPAALSSNTQNISYMTSAILNVTVKNALNNVTISTYTGQLNNSAYSFSENQSTTNGSVYYYVIPANYTLLIDATGFSYSPQNVTVGAGITNITVYLYATESIWFIIYNEENNSLLYQPNTTVELIGTYASYNYTTSNNASIFAQLVVPDSYIIRYYATGFGTRLGYVTVSERSTQNITLYLLPAPQVTNVTITILQQDGARVESALVKVLKYDINTNSYIIREQILTDYNGEAVASIEFGTEFYKFLVEYPIGTVALETTPAYITSTDIVLVIPSTQAGAAFENILNVNGDVTFNSATNNFRFTWSDSGLILQEACLYVYRVQNNYTGYYLGSNCSTSSAGTLLFAIDNSTAAEYYAVGQVYMNNLYYDIDTAWADLRDANSWGLLGVFVAMALTVTIALLFIKISPQVTVMTLPVGVTFTNYIGVTQFASWVPWGLLIISLIIVIAMGRDR